MSDQGRVRNITDLARLAGVSPGTVSRALADSQLIAKKTREKIQQLAREHDFRPNVMARNLRIKRAGAIGVLIPLGHETGQHISDPFFMTMLGHLADALTERGHDLLLSRVIPKDPDWLNRVVDSGRVDGVILIGQSDQIDVIEKMASRYLPLVAWGANLPGKIHCSVGSDNRKGGEIATRHLIERGCRNFAFFGDPVAPEISERLEGCRAALSAVNMSSNLSILPAHLTAETAHPAISKWLDDTRSIPNGIIAASDVIAMSALRALAEHGVTVPGQVHVIGYDDLPFSNQTVPTLSTVKQDLAAGAAHLVDLLFRRIAGEETGSVVLEPELVIRQSS
ncbi:LacI family transcriptional regulator [Sphingorhabdus sp. IMCC26285]|jgi:DNA-binding LacI/PurR family transcriptional regulator|uniref:LacI family transcriptional regulator n=1 Tax=Sphingorhabdus profundilacus TaxID=2509718 RepID=A0A6I4M8A1_9SPHN|nr:LacI family DNA-binding transcriptional regulator [Sphingorhabdus profundilacus]MVZ98345.1 LacI family transcriptional regulator [Sphingorhabdus profundilacus]